MALHWGVVRTPEWRTPRISRPPAFVRLGIEFYQKYYLFLLIFGVCLCSFFLFLFFIFFFERFSASLIENPFGIYNPDPKPQLRSNPRPGSPAMGLFSKFVYTFHMWEKYVSRLRLLPPPPASCLLRSILVFFITKYQHKKVSLPVFILVFI